MVDPIKKQRKNFKLFMKRKDLTAYAWAKKAGITEGTIRSYLSGRSSSLTYKTLQKLADAVDSSPKEIVDPDIDYEELLDNSQYLERQLLESVMEKIDSIIDKKNLKILSKDRRKLYFAWYDLKAETRNLKDNEKQDEDRISAMLRLVG